MKYKNEDEILALLKSFEDATGSRDDWKHAEHLVVVLCYLSHHDFETATGRMREGILHLLKTGFKVDLNKEMPYHETITVFWMRTVANFHSVKNGVCLLDTANELSETFDKDYPLKFYSRELLFSDEARARFVTGDLYSETLNGV